MSGPTMPNPRTFLAAAGTEVPVAEVLHKLASFAAGPLAEAVERALPANSLRRGDVRWPLMAVIGQSRRLAEAWDAVLAEQASLDALDLDDRYRVTVYGSGVEGTAHPSLDRAIGPRPHPCDVWVEWDDDERGWYDADTLERIP